MPTKRKTTPAASTSPPAPAPASISKSSPTVTAHKRSPSGTSLPNSTTTPQARSRSRSRSRSRGAPQGGTVMSSPRAVRLPFAPPEESTIPSLLRFVLATVISLSLASALNTFAVQFTGPELASVSRSLDKTWEIYIVVAWKVLELGVGWISGLDSTDIAALTFLTHLPHFYLLHTYYAVPRLPLVVYLQINVFANSTPFYLLRASNVHNLSIPTDLTTGLATILLGSALYALPLFSSLTTWLPASLAVHFEGLRTLAPAHAASFPGLLTLPPVLALGYFSYRFVFVPLVSASPASVAATAGADIEKVFNPSSATLLETLQYNLFWPLYRPPRQQLFLLRTFVLVAWTAANTLFLTNRTIDGCDLEGAARWAAMWGVSAALNGVTMGWVAGAL